MTTTVFNIPASKKTSTEHQIAKFNTRAVKLGMSPLICGWGKAFEDDNVLYLPLEVSGDLTVTFDGWEFVVSLQHLQSGENIIRSLDKNFQVPEQYRTGSRCEHCQVKRYRKDTYLLRHTNGDIIQVGSTCIDDFLGGNSPENILKKAALIAEVNSYMEGTATGGSGGDIVFPVVEFLAHACATISQFGWVSKAKAAMWGSTEVATATRVLDNLIPYTGATTFKPSQEDVAKAEQIVLWAEDLTDSECHKSDYYHNLRAIVRSGMVGMRTAGFAASMVQAYEKATQVVVPPNQNSMYVGTVGDRIQRSLILKSDILFNSAFGETHLYVFNDDLGNVLVWRASKNNNLELSKKYEVKGTIKSHSDYKGTYQTELTRCKVI